MTIRSTQAVRPLALLLAGAAAVLTTGCVIAPNTGEPNIQRMEEVRKMSEQATTTCGAGNVKEVNAKSFSCK
jgi:predicted aconitase with swiveling domain